MPRQKSVLALLYDKVQECITFRRAAGLTLKELSQIIAALKEAGVKE
jgi:hypothetical protein